MEISPNDLVNKSFKGSCIVNVYDYYCESCKSTILSYKKFMLPDPLPRIKLCEIPA